MLEFKYSNMAEAGYHYIDTGWQDKEINHHVPIYHDNSHQRTYRPWQLPPHFCHSNITNEDTADRIQFGLSKVTNERIVDALHNQWEQMVSSSIRSVWGSDFFILSI